ncbi:MAG: methyltransferase domain-containing protein [Solirubrobacterales bacterium]
MAVEPELTAACATAYAHPAVRWLLGGELHPGGSGATRRALELISLEPGETLLDVACGDGASAMLAAREFGCLAAGLECAPGAVAEAQSAAESVGLGDRAAFIHGDAHALPFGEGSFDAVLCECALSTFPDPAAALAEIHRVLRPGGRVAISDVTTDPGRLPAALLGALGGVACVAGARSAAGYELLLGESGFEPIATERRDDDAAAMAARAIDRLRGARLLGFGDLSVAGFDLDDALELGKLAQRAIDDGALGYAILAGRRR